MHPHLLHIRKITGSCWWRSAKSVEEPQVKRVSVQGRTGTSSVWHYSETRGRNLQGCSSVMSRASVCYGHPVMVAGTLASMEKVSAVPKQKLSSPAFLPVTINTINTIDALGVCFCEYFAVTWCHINKTRD